MLNTTHRTRFRQIREAKNLTQADIALRGQVAIGTAQRFDAGLLPRQDTPALERVAAVLGVTCAELREQD